MVPCAVLEVHQFSRDASVAEAWLLGQEPYLSSREIGQSVDEVEKLIKRHEAFEKSAATWDERFSALERLTTVSGRWALCLLVPWQLFLPACLLDQGIHTVDHFCFLFFQVVKIFLKWVAPVEQDLGRESGLLPLQSHPGHLHL